MNSERDLLARRRWPHWLPSRGCRVWLFGRLRVSRTAQTFDRTLQRFQARTHLAWVKDRALERLQARAHLTRVDVPPDEVADGGSDRDAHGSSGQADQAADDGEYSRKHAVRLS